MTASLVVGSSIVMTVAEGPTLFGVPLLTFFGLLGYLIAFVNSLWIILSIWRSGRRLGAIESANHSPRPRDELSRDQHTSKTRHPKKAIGDRRQEWRFHWQIPLTETKPHPRNAAVPRRFERHSLIDAQRPDSLAGAAGFELAHQKIVGLPLSCDARSGSREGHKFLMQRFESCRPSQPVRSSLPNV